MVDVTPRHGHRDEWADQLDPDDRSADSEPASATDVPRRQSAEESATAAPRRQRAEETAIRAARPAADWLLRNRRQILTTIGLGTVVAGGVGGTIALFAEGDPLQAVADNRPGAGPAYLDRDSSYVGQAAGDDLGIRGEAGKPSEAAARAAAATPIYTSPLVRDAEPHLIRRATFGPTPDDLADVKKLGIDAWLEQQINPTSIADPVADGVLNAYPTIGMSIAQVRKAIPGGSFDAMVALAQATLARQIWSKRQLFEVMVDFWNNLLHITNPFDAVWDSRSPYDTEVIRANALGKFSTMLLAAARHPAMLRYLNNDQSDKRSVNENYGRELLELHSVGVDGGYTETDVRNSAYILTGRTIDQNGMFTYQARKHKTGPVKVLGFSDPNSSANNGLAMGDAYVTYLATHPSTANYIAHKLAVRFVCDTPPQSLTDRLAEAYLDNGTAIVPVLRTLFRSMEFWIATGLKTRRPLENYAATARTLGVMPGADTRSALESLIFRLTQIGHAPMNWAQPNGFPDVAVAWSSAQGTLGLWNSHQAWAQAQTSGLTYPKLDNLVTGGPTTNGAYLDALAVRLVGQPMRPQDKSALLTFLGVADNAPVKGTNLGGKLQYVVPLILDSVYHALR
jgi:uncharacterized protein (DUF1800 family)